MTESSNPSDAPSRSSILVLIFLIASAAWSVVIMSHELLGHGGHCLLDPNCTPIYADAMYFQGEYANGIVSEWQRAMGSLVTIAVALLAAAILWRTQPKSFAIYTFLWAVAGAGLVSSGAYIGFGWLIHPGMDWARLVVLAGDTSLVKGLVITVGVLLMLAGILFCRRHMPRIESANGVVTGLPVVLTSYIAFSLTSIAASAFVPTDDRLFMLFGGFGNGALFMMWFLLSAAPKGGPSPVLQVQSSRGIAITSLVVVFTYVVVLGRGVNL